MRCFIVIVFSMNTLPLGRKLLAAVATDAAAVTVAAVDT